LSSDDWQWVSSFLLGAAFVVAYCAARLEGPFADRSYTTFYRYSIATCYYAIGYLGAYYLIVATSSWALRTMVPDSARVLSSVMGTPAWVALLVVVASSRLPGLSTLDQMFRRHARHIGGIPMEAKRLRDAVRIAKRELGEDSSTEIHYSVLRRGLDLGNMRSVPDYTLHALFLHASELKHCLEKCQQEPRFARFFDDNARPLHDLSRRFDYLLFKSSRGLDAVGGLNELVDRTSGKSDNWDSLGSLVESEVYAGRSNVLDPAISTSRLLLNTLRDDMRFFIDDTAMLLARLTLYYGWTERSRVGLLKQIGVPVPPIAQPRYRLLFVVFAVVFVTMLLGTTLFGTAGATTAREVAGLLLMVPTLFVAALFCAVYPKQYFAFANVSVFGRPPYLFFIFSGVAAATLAFVISLAFRTLMYQDGEYALRRALESSPWLLMSFTVAIVVAVLIQDARSFESAAHQQRRRWRDALILTFALSTAGVVVQLLLPYTNPSYQPRPWAVAISAVIGAFIGYFVPGRFRTVCTQEVCPVPAVHSEELSSPLIYSKAS
jgi:putative flippase GtrA